MQASEYMRRASRNRYVSGLLGTLLSVGRSNAGLALEISLPSCGSITKFFESATLQVLLMLLLFLLLVVVVVVVVIVVVVVVVVVVVATALYQLYIGLRLREF